MDEEVQWMLEAKSGNSSSFAHIVERYQKPLYNFFYRFFGNGSHAEDATQNLFLQLFRNLPRYEATASVKTYLYRCAKNLAINLSRRNALLSFLSLEDEENPIELRAPLSKQPDKIFEVEEKIRLIQKALTRLSHRQRIAVIYHYFEDCPIAEIAQRMEISATAVESLLWRARAILKENLLSP